VLPPEEIAALEDVCLSFFNRGICSAQECT
jgi:hypothetical protein